MNQITQEIIDNGIYRIKLKTQFSSNWFRQIIFGEVNATNEFDLVKKSDFYDPKDKTNKVVLCELFVNETQLDDNIQEMLDMSFNYSGIYYQLKKPVNFREFVVESVERETRYLLTN